MGSEHSEIPGQRGRLLGYPVAIGCLGMGAHGGRMSRVGEKEGHTFPLTKAAAAEELKGCILEPFPFLLLR